MTVKELIDILTKEVDSEDINIAEIEIWCDGQEYRIKSMVGWGLLANIAIHIEPIKSNILRKSNIKKEHAGRFDEIKSKILKK